MFIAALFTTAKAWKQPKCLSTEEWIKKLWPVYPVDYYSAIKKNGIMPFAATWMDTVLNIHWKDWCWSWNSNTWTTWCEELTHWKRPWCWERLKAGEGNNRGCDGWMASLTWWTWIWASSGVGDGQGSLADRCPRGGKETDPTKSLNNSSPT